MSQELVKLPDEVLALTANVSAEKRNEVQTVLNHVFDGVSKMREQLDKVIVSDATDKVNMKLAETIRLGVRRVRLDAEDVFDAKREELRIKMLSDKTEDSLWLKSKQMMQIATKEIETLARWKEETKQRFDAEQRELKAQARANMVAKFNTEILRGEFESMSDDTFAMFLKSVEATFNEKVEADRKAKEAEEARIKAEEAERERIKAENARLKAEADAKEKELAIERERADAVLKAEREKAKAESEKAAAELAKIEAEKKRLEAAAKAKADEEAKENARLKAEADAQAKEQAIERERADAVLKAEREKAKAEAEKAAAELAKIEAEKKRLEAAAKEKADEEAKENARLKAEADAKELAAKKAAKAPVKEKLTIWVDRFALPATDVNNATVEEIKAKFEAFKNWSKSQIEKI